MNPLKRWLAQETADTRITSPAEQKQQAYARGGFPDRRVRPVRLRDFASILEASEALNTEIDRQIEEARKKQDKRSHWGLVGDIESQAAQAAHSIVNIMPDGVALQTYVEQCHAKLLALADQYRQDDNDADGYGLGTVHAIARVLVATQ